MEHVNFYYGPNFWLCLLFCRLCIQIAWARSCKKVDKLGPFNLYTKSPQKSRQSLQKSRQSLQKSRQNASSPPNVPRLNRKGHWSTQSQPSKHIQLTYGGPEISDAATHGSVIICVALGEQECCMFKQEQVPAHSVEMRYYETIVLIINFTTVELIRCFCSTDKTCSDVWP